MKPIHAFIILLLHAALFNESRLLVNPEKDAMSGIYFLVAQIYGQNNFDQQTKNKSSNDSSSDDHTFFYSTFLLFSLISSYESLINSFSKTTIRFHKIFLFICSMRL